MKINKHILAKIYESLYYFFLIINFIIIPLLLFMNLKEEKLQKLMILSELNKELTRLQDTLPTDLDHTD